LKDCHFSGGRVYVHCAEHIGRPSRIWVDPLLPEPHGRTSTRSNVVKSVESQEVGKNREARLAIIWDRRVAMLQIGEHDHPGIIQLTQKFQET
jgi:hypothetical protein